ncbi:hypothetical protein L915_04471 [Phytophthora nicotianae]|uniref:BZIP domain-containing protein n=2 Tax=Phytophthora nicotianae TaxID=4792 RepID=V9FLB7_PHYNI|nr:hypothetical protein F443_04598 [Phytophthora nicotianae P1569]ETK92129.1 hypothetical protein L915_04471 [Phytophthora nicotianae]
MFVNSRESGPNTSPLPHPEGEHSTRLLFRAQTDHSPRRHAALFTRKRDMTELYGTQPEQSSIVASALEKTTASGDYTGVYVAALATKRKVKRLSTQRRRQQSRDNQARYRIKQCEHVSELLDRVDWLREEVQKLSVKRYTLCYGVQTKNTVWHVAVEYFRLFRHGYLAPPDELNLALTEASSESNLRTQEWFLRSAMSSDVAIGESTGVDTLIEQCRRYLSYLGSPIMLLQGIEEQPLGALVATASLSFTITENSGAVDTPSRSTTSLSDYTSFVWDDSTGCVTQLDGKVDVLKPLLRLLGNLEDVNRVLEKSLITSAYLIDDLPTDAE